MHYSDVESFVLVNDTSFRVTTPKLTIADLKTIAASHGIFFHSKMNHKTLQLAIEGHICHNCSTFVSVFELIDHELIESDRKLSHSVAVRKSRHKHIEKYKKQNLAAVQKYKRNHPEIQSQQNLAAVYKFALQNPDKHSQQNLAAVQKFALQNPDKHSQQNLAAVQKFALQNPNKHSQQHLSAVNKYKLKNPEKFRKQNLTAVQKFKLENPDRHRQIHQHAVKAYREKTQFPPDPPSMRLQHTIVSDFCKETSPNKFIEAGCAVCGKLTLESQLKYFSDTDLTPLIQEGVTQIERQSSDDPIVSSDAPVLIDGLDRICKSCYKSLSKGKRPVHSLANGLWLGEVPMELSDLSYTEQLLIARVRHNRCIVRVSSGMHKMRANAITFANPTPKIYNILPPPIEDLDEVLAFIYTGPCKPTRSDFERTPLLVRRNKVATALNWLKLNHCDYFDLEISEKNLAQYPENDIPVVVEYRKSFSNKNPESTAVHDMEEEEGTETGMCPFVVHGLTGEEYTTKSLKAIKAIALKHLKDNKNILAIGHSKDPQSIYSNPQLFPQMMPWLFPYGLGGIGNCLIQGNISEIKHKRHLLMYYDKRFQKDPHFPLIAFNHEQIKQATTGGYLLAEKEKFDTISQRLMDVDVGVLNYIARKMEDGEKVIPETDEEKLCFQLIKDIDHVGSHVKGSLTNKKYMRNEIWSLISFAGAPSWFITFSPADNMHPISLYYADTKEEFTPELRGYDERYRLIAENPVAGARFFDMMVRLFIKHVLGVKSTHTGFYGDTEAYYGTVEQQGRLTLHMHMLLWLRGSLSPQEIRDRIMDPNSDFQKAFVEYLESVHIGEFMTGTMDEVKAQVAANSQNKDYKDPTQTLPEMPPPICKGNHDITSDYICRDCSNLKSWWQQFRETVDDLILHSNVHNCGRYKSGNEKVNQKDRPSCINKHGKCRARFPRPVFDCTEVDPQSGALNVKKGEAWINTLTPVVTYLLRCNTDVTSLLSGTSIKAIVAYISDYITKPGLKTYSIFDTIRSVFDKNTEMLGSSMKTKDKARKLITQITNALTAKLEIGGPMAALYLLGNPDHYTSHRFIPVYWKNYVRQVLNAWTSRG